MKPAVLGGEAPLRSRLGPGPCGGDERWRATCSCEVLLDPAAQRIRVDPSCQSATAGRMRLGGAESIAFVSLLPRPSALQSERPVPPRTCQAKAANPQMHKPCDCSFEECLPGAIFTTQLCKLGNSVVTMQSAPILHGLGRSRSSKRGSTRARTK